MELAMASQFPLPRGAYDEVTLSTLNQVFKEVWSVLQAHDPFREFEKDDEAKTSVARSLMALIDGGVSDPDELRKKALENLPLAIRPPMTS
jgi:hypothetical protein